MAARPRAGDLRHRVTLDTLTETADSFGQPIQSWTSSGPYWAAIRPASGREVEIGKQLEAQVSHVITMRYVGEIGPTGRISFGSRTFAISQALLKDEIKDQYTLYCIEQDSGIA